MRHHLVLGLGIVTVSEGKASAGGADGAAPAAQAEHFKATGFLLGANPALRGLVVGQCERQSVCVPREADLLVDAVSWSDGRFTVVVSPVH